MQTDLLKQAFGKIAEGFALLESAMESTTASEVSLPQDEGKVDAAAPAKRGRKPKAQATAAPAPADDDAEDLGDDEDGEDLSGGDAPTITVEELRTKLVSYAQKNSKEKTYALMQKFGGKKVTDIDPSKYAELAKALDKGV